MSRTPRVIDGNPTTFNPNGSDVLPGDFVVDFSGAVPGVSVIERTAPLINVRVELAPASSIPVLPVADVIAVGQSSTGPGNLRVLFTVTNLGVAVVGRPVMLVLHSSGIVSLNFTVGVGVLIDTPADGHWLGLTGAAGVVEFIATGTTKNSLNYVIATVGPTMGVDSASFLIP